MGFTPHLALTQPKRCGYRRFLKDDFPDGIARFGGGMHGSTRLQRTIRVGLASRERRARIVRAAGAVIATGIALAVPTGATAAVNGQLKQLPGTQGCLA